MTAPETSDSGSSRGNWESELPRRPHIRVNRMLDIQKSRMSCKGACWCGDAEARAGRFSVGIRRRHCERSSLCGMSLSKELAVP